ncbi:unnamed protein product [Camellia sinensis]
MNDSSRLVSNKAQPKCLSLSLSLQVLIFNNLCVSFLTKATMSLTTLMFRSLVRLLISLVGEPVASISTLLYYSDLLPQNIILQRMVRHELLDQENYLFHFLINFLRCFW